MSMYKIAVLGDRESVLGFQALGLDVHTAETVEAAKKTLHQLARDGETAIIYLTEQLAVQMQDEINRYKDEVMPAIILIPGKDGSLGIGMQNITDSVERAVGADIL
ncbi:MAG: V-type ATP synthase subunit F [Clostridiales bacterium]|nr:V-type ATP synthase subunit F [Clostridiales bacterium]MCD7753968.1 V-type ATP synthase subunit F [Clostridiales bacterium]MCD7760837.1 V-type ATP synthase subunit F [Clostridiales bacterium]MCD7802168.1 V-type ATP synthase subunit F [Clostridiales bacterium]MCD7881313.1 V-type ATP synthase subunit F [Clostridiales bacterium]